MQLIYASRELKSTNLYIFHGSTDCESVYIKICYILLLLGTIFILIIWIFIDLGRFLHFGYSDKNCLSKR